MFEYPTYIPSEPSSFELLASGIVTLAIYLTVTGKWRMLRPAAALPTQTAQEAPTVVAASRSVLGGSAIPAPKHRTDSPAKTPSP